MPQQRRVLIITLGLTEIYYSQQQSKITWRHELKCHFIDTRSNSNSDGFATGDNGRWVGQRQIQPSQPPWTLLSTKFRDSMRQMTCHDLAV